MIDQSVGDVMTPSVRTIPPETTISAVATLFADHDIGSAVVVEPETGEYLGIVTESDIMQQVAAGADINSVRVAAFLSTPLVTIASTENIHTAAALMKEHSIRRLPVIDDDELVGILTTTNLTHYLPRLRNTILRERDDLVAQ
ncbi:CBS domain-containing protein [Haloarcula nitratireducens]|uniref:CBS domain-containing protein n=1 Tax=Haloarcula nitratireducens TaxID=2487749 RepID=A0AAW4PJV6_9EURY|nr:CBS domain-containing protein [Halomicroarcula nitratireducens]MBX0297655.1 CBS domain-containing protein [Halomicroarcula nitratireducens]